MSAPLSAAAQAVRGTHKARWRDYLELTKPRVVALIVLTAIVGTLLADSRAAAARRAAVRQPGHRAGGAVRGRDQPRARPRIDARMARTRAPAAAHRPLHSRQALASRSALGVASMAVLLAFVNALTAVLTFLSLIGYAVLYTVGSSARRRRTS